MIPEITPQEKQTEDFMNLIGSPIPQKILKALTSTPLRYTELLQKLGFTAQSSKTAYHIKNLKKFYCIENKATKYHITWKGLKAVQIYTMIDQFQNTTMENYDPNQTFEFVQIQSSKDWLEPYLEKKIKQILNAQVKQVIAKRSYKETKTAPKQKL